MKIVGLNVRDKISEYVYSVLDKKRYGYINVAYVYKNMYTSYYNTEDELNDDGTCIAHNKIFMNTVPVSGYSWLNSNHPDYNFYCRHPYAMGYHDNMESKISHDMLKLYMTIDSIPEFGTPEERFRTKERMYARGNNYWKYEQKYEEKFDKYFSKEIEDIFKIVSEKNSENFFGKNIKVIKK